MPFLLDTNVLCEATSKQPDPRVLAWIEANADDSLVSCISLGEIWRGIHLLPERKRKRGLARWAANIESDFAERILPLDTEVWKVWGQLYAKHEAKGFNMGVFDSLLGATAISHQLTLATRNTGDFPKEVKMVNPWLG